MSKKSIRSIIFLMSISLLGLIAFQIYWISYEVAERESKFDRDIQQLLAKTVDDIEAKEAYDIIKGLVEKKNTVKLNNIPKKDVKVIISSTTDGISLSDEEESILLMHEANAEDSANKKILNWKNSTVVTDKIVQNGKARIRTITAEEVQLEEFENKKDLLSKMVDKVAYEFTFGDISFTERVEGISVDSILKEQMVQSGYEQLNYYYIVRDLTTDSTILSGGKSFNKDQNLNNYEILFDENGTSSGQLQISIPNKTTIIFKSLWLTLLLSSILTIILISTFIYTINSILKQKRISQMKADFINNMTHEFKTPVATINLAVDSILHKEVKNSPNEIEKLGGIIKKENNRMNQQIESLLNIAMFDKEDFELQKAPVDVHLLLNEIKDDFEIKVTSQAGDISLALAAKKHLIITDKMHFYNAIRNIVDNGIKYSPNAFRLKIKTDSTDHELVISISDQGIGMNKETQQRIFDRFYRKTEGDIHTTKGFGLGLPYVKEVVQKMNGTIQVQSELGKGSCFTIKLPFE